MAQILVSSTTTLNTGNHTLMHNVYTIDSNANPRLIYVSGSSMGINTITPQGTLDIVSTTLPFLPPRMTTSQKNAISNPAVGSVLFDTTIGNVCVFTGATSPTWKTINSV